jgi:hypothetical protein
MNDSARQAVMSVQSSDHSIQAGDEPLPTEGHIMVIELGFGSEAGLFHGHGDAESRRRKRPGNDSLQSFRGLFTRRGSG